MIWQYLLYFKKRSCLVISKLLFSENFYDNTLNIGFSITKNFTELFKVIIHTHFPSQMHRICNYSTDFDANSALFFMLFCHFELKWITSLWRSFHDYHRSKIGIKYQPLQHYLNVLLLLSKKRRSVVRFLSFWVTMLAI